MPECEVKLFVDIKTPNQQIEKNRLSQRSYQR